MDSSLKSSGCIYLARYMILAPRGQTPYFLFLSVVSCPLSVVRCYPLPIPYSLFPIPYSLFPIPYSLFPIPYSLFPIPYIKKESQSKLALPIIKLRLIITLYHDWGEGCHPTLVH